MAAAFQRPTGLSCILRSQQVTHAWHVRKRTRGMSWKDPLPRTQSCGVSASKKKIGREATGEGGEEGFLLLR